MTEVCCKDRVTRQHSGIRERERETNRIEVKEDRGRGGETNESLILCCSTKPH